MVQILVIKDVTGGRNHVHCERVLSDIGLK